jgi:preprotein translocase subunit SecE
VARNRKRAKERRARRPQPVGTRAREDIERAREDIERAREELPPAPDPLEHASADAELAKQAELPPDHELELSPADEAEFEEEAEESAEEEEQFEEDGRGKLAPSAGPISERRPGSGSRLITFLQGSWAELQRVQWPDRRQVMQATGVVIGFVIVAGLFLGAADWAATHLLNYILYGHY